MNHFAYKEKHEPLKDGEEPGTFEIYISLTGTEKGLGKNQLAALRNPTKCVYGHQCLIPPLLHISD